jgi:archaellum biogenesis ATPase FlaH
LNNEENTKLIKRFLNALSMLFSDEHVDCDCAVFNAARISRLPGSYSCKGANNDPTRPQRRCRFLKVPDEINVNAREYFEKIANMYPEEETKPSRENNYSIERFDLDAFIAKHNIQIRKVETVADGKKYILDHCLFNEQHKGKDAVIFQRTSGAIAYHCFHQSCSQYTWRDVRTMFEPDAYSRTPYNTYTPRRGYGAPQKEPFVPIAESVDKGKKWLQMSDIKRVDIADLMSIPTGFHELDKKIVGLFAGDLTVLSGLSASGKTSWLDCLALNVVNQGYKVAIWSGEMQDWRFQGWINQIAAGKNYTRKKQGYENLYYVPNNIADKINVWLDDKLFLYNNDYGNRFQQLFNDVKELVEEKGVQLVVLDNLAALNIEDYDSDKYSNQTKFILDIKDYAKKKNIHIVLVAHPRKQNYFLRREGISGSADLTNIADNVILVHRVGKDFETRATEFFGENQAKEYMQYSTVIEVSKNRQLGITDFLTGIYYEHESKRLKNSIAENVLYGWYETAEQGTMIEPNGDFAIDGVSPWGDSSVYEDEEAPF